MSEQEIIQSVKSGSLFGMVECDIRVPEHLKEYFSEMTPVFKHANIHKEDTSPLMKEYAARNTTHKIVTFAAKYQGCLSLRTVYFYVFFSMLILYSFFIF